jgi:hypothetical protein
MIAICMGVVALVGLTGLAFGFKIAMDRVERIKR